VSQESLLFCYGQLPCGVGDVSPPARLTMMLMLMWLWGTKFIFIEVVAHVVNPHTHQLKICDFESVEKLVHDEPNISYICSRYYRAPGLIFGATEYTTALDMWSVGCVLAKLLLGQGKCTSPEICSCQLGPGCVCFRPRPPGESSRTPCSCFLGCDLELLYRDYIEIVRW
ncbi:hypothetical protein IFM89_015444, partial [Coptis chinensis]